MAFEFEEAAEAAHELIKEEVLDQNNTIAWVDMVALSTMVMALLSALGALLASFTANELMLSRTKEILEISHMESDRINIEVLNAKHAILNSLGIRVDLSEIESVNQYQKDIGRMKPHTASDEVEVKHTIFEHELFAIGVTLLSIAITLCGMSLVAKRKPIWVIALVFGGFGTGFVMFGAYKMLL